MSKTIVVPLIPPRLDASRVTARALPVARALARRGNRRVVLVTVIQMPREYVALASALGLDPAARADWVHERRQYLEQVAATFPESDVTVEVRIGDPATELLELAGALDDPVVVMASHAETGLTRILVGSVAFRVVHEATWPVIVVPAHTEVDIDGVARLERILVPLDGSRTGEQVLDAVLALLGPQGLDLRLLHVIEPPIDFPKRAHESYLQQGQEWATTYLGEIAQRLSPQGVSARTEVRIGRAAEEIQHAAREHGIDLLAMATHGRRGVQRLVFGSVVERVLHEVRVPLLLHRPTEPEHGG